MKPANRRTGAIGHRLTLTYVLGVFVPLVLSNVLVLRGLLLEARQQQAAFVESTLIGVVEAIQREFEPIQRITEVVYADTTLQRFLSMEYPDFEDYFEVHGTYLTPAITRFVAVFQGVARIAVYSSNQAIGVSEGYLGLDERSRATVWYRAVSDMPDDVFAMVHTDTDPRTQVRPQQYVSVFRRLPSGPGGVLEHILRIDLRPSVFVRHLNPEGIDGVLTVIDGAGTVAAETDPAVVAPAGGTTIRELSFDTGGALANWTLRAQVTVGDVAAVWSFRWTVLLVVSGLIVAISSLLVLSLSRSIARRLSRMAEQMRKVEVEDFSPILPIEGADEISQLMSRFNLMAKRIDRLINDGYKMELEQSRLLAARRSAALDALQSQVNPHFLYNVLESIRMKAQVKGETETALVIQKVSRSLRTISSWKHDLVPLDEELAFAEDYMDMQRYRFGGRLSYRQQIDPAVRDVLIPKATIQTLVENACVHGLLERDSDGAIEVTVVQEGSEVLIRIADNGAGCDPEPVRALFEAEVGEHIGIPNVYQRLRLHYGDAASLDFQSRPGGGTTVTVRYTPKEAQ